MMAYINPTKIRILYLEQYGDIGWRWYHECVDPSHNRYSSYYRTNKMGCGLWDDIEPKQIRGTCQFSLSNDRKNAYQQIRRWIIKQYRMPLD